MESRPPLRLLLGSIFVLVGFVFLLLGVRSHTSEYLAMPAVIVDEPDSPQRFRPSGWQSDALGEPLCLAPSCDFELDYRLDRDAPSGDHVLRVAIPAGSAVAGVDWLHPSLNHGERPGYSAGPIRELRLWARGERGGERVFFKVGGGQGRHRDFVSLHTPALTLTTDWQQLRFEIDGHRLGNLGHGFGIYSEGGDDRVAIGVLIDEVVLR